MTTLTQFAVKMSRAPAQINAAKKQMVTAAALAITTTVRTEIAGATRGTSRLSGVGLRGVKVGAGFDVKGTANPTAIVSARGPLHLIERDTKEHDIRPRRRGRQAIGNASRGFGPAASAHVRGTTGKHPFEKGVAAGTPVALKAAEAVVAEAVLRVVKG